MEPKGKEKEQYWIKQLASGNNKAVSYFYDLHYASLVYFANRLIQDEAEATDIVAECFIKLWSKYGDFSTTENIKAFLYIACRNSCLSFLRDIKRRTAAQQLYFSQLEQSENNIAHQIIEAEFLQILDKEVDELPEMCRKVFHLLYFEGKKTDEIAEELNLSVQTVRNYKTRAVEKLKTSFLQKGISGPFFIAFLILIEKL
jgi:RNA polymerase sigma-70 factor (family 1)